jgi:hypothetical protein
LEADAEIKEFNDWLTCDRLPMVQEKTPSQDSVGTLAAVFLPGWWIGRDR